MIPPLPPRFLNWRLIDGEKIPVDLTGRKINAHDPANHVSYERAFATGMPVAYAMVEGDGWFFLDLDKCLQPDGQWRADAVAIFQAFPGCWAEVSQSGRGLHIMGRCNPAQLQDRKHKWDGWLEFYTGGRFIAFGATGWQPIGGTAAEYDWTAQLLKLVPQKAILGALPEGVDPRYTGPTDDADLIRKALAASGGAAAAFGMRASFSDLWMANAAVLARIWPAYDGTPGAFDHSSADASLMAHLAFWTGKDMPRMDRLFRQSALMRPKYQERADYRTDTVSNAARLCTKVYDAPVAPAPGGAAGTGGGSFYMTTAEQIEHFRGCIYISDLHRVMMADGRILKPEVFNAVMGGYIFQMQENNIGPSKKAFEAFTENRAHRFPRVTRTMFNPALPGGTVVLDSVNTYFKPDVDMTPGDVSKFLYLVEKLLPDPTDRAILLSYLAAVVQYPGVKFQWCPVLQGCEGNGKTALFGCLSYAVGKHYSYVPRADQIGGRFNAWVARRIFCLIEEIHMAGRREILDALKPLITNIDLEAEDKGTSQLMIENRANFGMCTNYKDAVIKTIGDRRYCIFYTAQQYPSDLVRDGLSGEFFPQFYGWLRTGGGYAAVAHYLATYPIDPRFNPAGACHRAPQTTSTVEARQRTMGPIESEVLEAAADNTVGFRGGWVSAWAMDQLMSKRRHSVSRNKQVEILESLGYVAWGRATRPLMAEGDGKRPMLFKAPGVEGGFEEYCKAQHYSI